METFEHEGLVVQGVDRFLADKPRAVTRGMLDREDLLQDARLAVLRAERRHDASRSAFSTYATRAIYFALVRATLRAAGLPMNTRKGAKKPQRPYIMQAGSFRHHVVRDRLVERLGGLSITHGFVNLWRFEDDMVRRF